MKPQEIVQDILFNDGIFIKFDPRKFLFFFFCNEIFVKADKRRFDEDYPYLLPKSYEKEFSDQSLLQSIVGEERKLVEVDAQCVRSVTFWSCGTRTVEHSIQNAYIHMIESAQYFIYIEVKSIVLEFFDEDIFILESIFYFNC